MSVLLARRDCWIPQAPASTNLDRLKPKDITEPNWIVTQDHDWSNKEVSWEGRYVIYIFTFFFCFVLFFYCCLFRILFSNIDSTLIRWAIPKRAIFYISCRLGLTRFLPMCLTVPFLIILRFPLLLALW